MPMTQSGSTYLPQHSTDQGSSVRSAEISYQARTVAAIVMMLASMWVF
jgi:hypothetical protein